MAMTQKDEGVDEKVSTSLILVHQNITGLASKFTEFSSLLCMENINLQFLCFSEHHMSNSNLYFINIKNYNLGASFCRRIYQKCGICMYVRKDVSYKSLNETRYCEEKILEICAIQRDSMINQIIIIIICVYRAPSGSFFKFLNSVEVMLSSLHRPKTEFIICGDVNVDYLCDDIRKQQLSQLSGSYNMLHTVNFPTRFQNSFDSAIDNVLINKAQLQLYRVLTLYNGSFGS